MMHVSQQFTPTQLLEAGHRAEAEGRLDLAAQFYRHLTEHYAFTAEAAEARNALGRVGLAQSQIWALNGAAHHNETARVFRRRPVAPRDHYRLGRALALLVRLVGWLLVMSGLAAPAIHFAVEQLAQGYALPRLPLSLVLATAGGLTGGGLLVVFAGQIARAIFDQANAVRDLVALERAKFGSE